MRKLIINLYKIKILKRLVPSVLKIFLKIMNKSDIIINHNNLLLKLNLKNPIDREIYLRDAYENQQIKYLRNKPQFVKITKAGFYESMVHNVDIVKSDNKY